METYTYIYIYTYVWGEGVPLLKEAKHQACLCLKLLFSSFRPPHTMAKAKKA